MESSSQLLAKATPLLEEIGQRLASTWAASGMSDADQSRRIDDLIAGQFANQLRSFAERQECDTRMMYIRANEQLAEAQHLCKCMNVEMPEELVNVVIDVDANSFEGGATRDFSVLSASIDEAALRHRNMAEQRLRIMTLITKQQALLKEQPRRQREIRAAYLEKFSRPEAFVTSGRPSTVREEQQEMEEGRTSGRRTVYVAFEADEVAAMGTDQDLSVERLDSMAAETMARIITNNEKLEAKIDEDAIAVKELWDRLGTPQEEQDRFAQQIDHLRSVDSEQTVMVRVSATVHGVGSQIPAHCPESIKELLLATCPAETSAAVAAMKQQLEDEAFIDAAAALDRINTEVNGMYTTLHKLSGDKIFAERADYGLFLSGLEEASLDERLEAVEKAKAAAATETASLKLRLEILQGTHSALQCRAEILKRQEDVAAMGPERLMSKDRHAAKQRMIEENLRRDLNVTMPKLLRKLREMKSRWESEMPAGAHFMLGGELVLETHAAAFEPPAAPAQTSTGPLRSRSVNNTPARSKTSVSPVPRSRHQDPGSAQRKSPTPLPRHPTPSRHAPARTLTPSRQAAVRTPSPVPRLKLPTAAVRQ